MRIIVNGTEREVDEELPLTALLPGKPQGTAVALNDTIVPRHRIGVVELAAGDRVEIVTAVQGG
ncbi:sulfur carrier protein ThiS [Nocardioides sp. JQ2195]|uniref:sulfur carrier protein ThiS n=1 Tax=Nocardioides sp. JQ2195 TaxID=2592334 RepID=UPI00143E2E31|nr:sulfur carrier protein ThiS [Nocardioides sp. JQ2195]QIX27754.1 sulfur carrier protein ThiS [Nocardioides sp. JQ2195]